MHVRSSHSVHLGQQSPTFFGTRDRFWGRQGWEWWWQETELRQALLVALFLSGCGPVPLVQGTSLCPLLACQEPLIYYFFSTSYVHQNMNTNSEIKYKFEQSFHNFNTETLSNVTEVKRAFFSISRNVYWWNSNVSSFVKWFQDKAENWSRRFKFSYYPSVRHIRSYANT